MAGEWVHLMPLALKTAAAMLMLAACFLEWAIK
jgi:hypothetical protein